jgi:hypothetical protein
MVRYCLRVFESEKSCVFHGFTSNASVLENAFHRIEANETTPQVVVEVFFEAGNVLGSEGLYH